MSTLLAILALLLAAAASAALILRVRAVSGRLARLEEHCEERLEAVEEAVEQMSGSDGETGDDRADARKRALEAERRFTEGIANILNFSYNAAGRKGGNS